VYNPAVTYYAGSQVSYVSALYDGVGPFPKNPQFGSVFECQATTTGNLPSADALSAYWFDLAVNYYYFNTNALEAGEIVAFPTTPTSLLIQNGFEPVTPPMLQLIEASVFGYPLVNGALGLLAEYTTQFASVSSNPLASIGCSVSCQTELGPGYVRYSWPSGLVPASPNSAPLPLFNLSGPEYVCGAGTSTGLASSNSVNSSAPNWICSPSAVSSTTRIQMRRECWQRYSLIAAASW